MKESTGFTLIEVLVVAVIVALVGGGVYVWQQKQVDEARKSAATTTVISVAKVTKTPTVTPTPDPYAGWKTYTASSGFSFRYPNRLELHEEKDPSLLSLLSLTDPTANVESAAGISVYTIDNSAQQTLTQYLVSQGMPKGESPVGQVVDGTYGLKTNSLPAQFDNTSVVVAKATTIYRFELEDGNGPKVSDADFVLLLKSVHLP